MNYQEAQKEFAKCRNKDKGKKLSTNCWLRKEENEFCIHLYNTNIVRISTDNVFTLDNGGWTTPTTRRYIENYSGINITQYNKVWYIMPKEKGNREEFFNGIKVNEKGKVLNPKSTKALKEVERKRKILDKLIKRYVNGFKELVNNGELQAPNGGDCWYCLMQTKDGKSLGDATNNDSHIINHLREQYYVPSLLFNAIKVNHTNPSFVYQYLFMNSKDGNRARQVLRYYFRKKYDNLLALI